jgi:hypothetical protein
LLLIALAITLIASPAMAKEGFYLGVNVLFNDISGDINSGDTFDSGDGSGLRGGYGLNRHLAVEAGIWKTKHDLKTGGSTADLKAGTLDLKINFPLSRSHIEPYLLAGVGTYTLEQNGFSADGKGPRIGIGLDIYLFPELNFNVGLTRNNVTFTRNGNDVEGKITTLDFGFTYHFI